jgi:gliding motility-associated transport system ATP-binding protein
MIRVSDLTKRYVDRLAVDGVSFSCEKGEILGLLGPNGAGKTTTMRVLTGFLPATSGTAEVAGFDVGTQSLEVRRRVGYLPEAVPLYPEMRVSEYLDFRARLKRVPRSDRTRAIAEAVDRCGLGDVRGRVIGQLSRGYRQRVGLADALLGRPPILVLDEPTVGLDPNQIREVRQLIRELGREHTIVLSTHILPEVEMVCGRVVIIHRGRVVAQDTPEGLRGQLAGGRRIRVEARAPATALREALATLPGISEVQIDGERDGFSSLVLSVGAGEDPREAIFRLAAERGLLLRELHAESMTLEDIFVRITTQEDRPEEKA